MFSNQFKVSRKAPGRIYVLPAIAMALLLVVTAVFLFSSAKAQTPAGDFCVEGIVIDWEEEPMGGITVTLETALGATIAKQTKTNEDDEGEFKFDPFDSNPNGWAAVPGYYTATVTLPGPYWKGVSPETAYNPPTPENPQLVFRLESGMDDCAQIRFKLAEIVEVYAWKMDSNHVPLPGWTIDATPGPGNIFAEPQDQNTMLDTTLSQTGTVKPAVFELTPGNWIFSERQPEPEGDHVRPDPFAPIVPIGGKQMLDVQPINYEVDPPYIIVFKNEFHNNGCVIARKYGMLEEAAPPEIDPVNPIEANQLLDYGADAQVPMTTIPGLFDSQGDPAGAGVYGAGGWGFALLAMDGTVVRKGVTDAEGIITFEGLPYGPYTIKEEDRPGWDEWTPRYVDVNLIDGTCQVVEFYNMQDDSGFCIEGYKLDANGGYGLAGWFIDVDPLDAGGFDPADPAERGDFYADDPYFNESKEKFVTDGVGMYKIGFPDNDYRIPGSRYEICEDDSVDGWLPHTPTCQVVELPKWPGACVQAKDFVNQQVGHAEKAKYEEMQDNPQTMDRVAPTGPVGPGEKGVYCKNSHTVQAGEGLFTIAADYNVSPQAMVDANPEVRDSPNWWVYEGQNLCIP